MAGLAEQVATPEAGDAGRRRRPSTRGARRPVGERVPDRRAGPRHRGVARRRGGRGPEGDRPLPPGRRGGQPHGLGRTDEADRAWKAGYRTARAAGHAGSMAWALWSGGTLARQRGAFRLAYRLLALAAEWGERGGDIVVRGYSLAGLAETGRIQGDYAAVEELHEQLLAEARRPRRGPPHRLGPGRHRPDAPQHRRLRPRPRPLRGGRGDRRARRGPPGLGLGPARHGRRGLRTRRRRGTGPRAPHPRRGRLPGDGPARRARLQPQDARQRPLPRRPATRRPATCTRGRSPSSAT